MYEKLGLVEESDLEKYRKKLGIRKGIDLTEIDVDDVDSILEASSNQGNNNNPNREGMGTSVNPKKRQTYMQRAKKDFDKEEFKKIVNDLQVEKAKL
jgi:hypothetical protein